VDPRARRGGEHTCVRCHDGTAGSGKLDLRGTTGGAGRLVSYQELLTGDPVIDPATGRPVTVLRNGVPEVQRGSPLVETSSGAANTAGQARKSRLTEILWGQTLLAGSGARTDHPNPPASCTRPRRAADARRKAPAGRVDGPGRPVLQRPLRRQWRRAHA
jgi:hypothetical protein